MENVEAVTFPEEHLLMTKKNGEEYGELPNSAEVDIDIGDTDDFQIDLSTKDWNKAALGYDCRIIYPGTEYGGLIKDIESVTKARKITLRGPSWRGMLKNKVVEPPEGENHLVLNGELNTVIRELLEGRFGRLFVVPDVATKITVKDWKVDRYVTLYDALIKLVGNYNYRLKITYIQPEDNAYGYVTVQAVPIKNYSEDLEYSEDGNISVDVRDYRGGVNHLVCAGTGENQERAIVHLYVQKDGSIGEKQYYTGLNEIAAVYEYTSADAAQLKVDGKNKLKELKNYKKCQMTIEGVDLELGDIVSGYDAVTNTQVKKPVIQKILKVEKGNMTIEYKIKGDE